MLKRVQNEPLHLHHALARQRFWQRQLMHCSVWALVASLAAWLIGLPLSWHLALVAVGFVGGFLRPARGALDWALTWIEAQSGLSYRTALELDAANRGDDPYGFREAVEARVANQLKRLEPPSLQPWWLPVLILALGLSLLPILSRGGTSQTDPTTAAQRPGSFFTDPFTAPQTPEISRGESGENGQEAATPDGSDPRQEAARDLGAVDQTFDTAGRSARDGASQAPADDGDTLSRFLQNLEQRPPEPERNEQGDGQSGMGGSSQQQGQQRQGDASGGAGQGEGNGQGDSQEQGDSGSQQSGPPGAQSGEQPDGSGSSAPRAEQGGSQPQPAPAPGDAQTGEQEGQAQAGQSEGENQGQGGGSPTEAQGDGQSAEEELRRGAGEGAGTQGAEATPGEPSELAAEPQSDPEGLEGRFLGGPSSIGGEVLLPGLDDKAAPVGQAPQGFERALEEAISEGRIPVEYQEILRDYYR